MALTPAGWRGGMLAITRRYAWTAPVAAVLSLVTSALEGLSISLLIPLLGTLSSAQPIHLPGPMSLISGLAAGLPADQRLIAFGGAIFALVLLKSIAQISLSAFVSWVDGKAAHELLCQSFAGLQGASYPFFLQNDAGRLFNIMSAESWRAASSVRVHFTMISSLSAVVVLGTFLLVLHWQLTLAVAAGVLLIRMAQQPFVRRAKRLSAITTEASARLCEHMWRSITGMRVIRIFGREAHEFGQFSASSQVMRRATFSQETLATCLRAGLEVAHAALFIVILIVGYRSGVPLPLLAAFLLLLYRAQPFVRALSQTRAELAAKQASVEEVEWLLEMTAKSKARQAGDPFRGRQGVIEFQHVGFSHVLAGRTTPILRDLSFTIFPGRSVALVGRSGAGKSTVVNLLCGLLEPTQGRILVDGGDLAKMDPQSWRSRVAIAGQDFDLLDGDIADNIRYGLLEATAEEIAEASRLAQIDEFIRSLPAGYCTDVGAGGLRLSGGQRQRVGLARALVRRPQLLILDEATNAVDGLSESAILNLLKDLPWSPTIIVVSHRSSTLATCDDCIVLDNGALVEHGARAVRERYQKRVHS